MVLVAMRSRIIWTLGMRIPYRTGSNTLGFLSRHMSKSMCTTTSSPLRLRFGVASIPNREKLTGKGEDAFFTLEPSERSGFHGMGVADGVGGWAEIGVDAGLYSSSLMEQAKLRLTTAPDPCPSDALAYAHRNVTVGLLVSMTKVVGSSTACIAVLDSSDKLHTINLGDSGFIIARRMGPDETKLMTLFKSPFQQHNFNTPRQLATNSGDLPHHGDTQTFALKPGDIIVLGTDGLWDNVFDTDILDSLEKNGSPDEMVQRLAKLALKMSEQTSKPTPWVERANQHHLFVPNGGKPDDITIIVAVASES